ncbi:MAG: hypothetical protein ACETVO_01155 [bacterium]
MGKTGAGIQLYLLTLSLILLLSLPKDGNTAGISTDFTEVVVRNLSIGKNYIIGQKVNRQLRVRNKGKDPIELKMEVLVPSKSELKEGYESIPDVSWIELEKEQFSVEPSKFAVTDVIITIPGDKKYLGKKYQAYIWSHTGGKGSLPIALGLKSRLLLEISGKERDFSQEFAGRFDFAVFPDEIILEHVKIDEVYDIKKVVGKILEVKNLSPYLHTYEIRSISAKRAGVRVEKGYEDCPDPDFLTFDKSEFGLERKKKSKVKMYLNFPKKEEYAGRKYMFVIRIRLVKEEFLLNRYLKLYVTTVGEF